jgi:hypothetical protein
MRYMARVGSCRDEPAILEIGSPTLCERPNSPAIVFKERLHSVIRQSGIGHLAQVEFSFLFSAAAPERCASRTVNRDVSVIPSV